MHFYLFICNCFCICAIFNTIHILHAMYLYAWIKILYINVCNSDVFSVVNMYLDHLKLCLVCIICGRYVCCSECYVVSNECDEPTPWRVLPFGAQGGEVMYFWIFYLGVSLVSWIVMISACVLWIIRWSCSSLF